MEMMIWSGPFAISWDLAFGSDSLLLGARWRWDSAFGRDSSIVCARWRLLYARVGVGIQPPAAIYVLCARVGVFA